LRAFEFQKIRLWIKSEEADESLTLSKGNFHVLIFLRYAIVCCGVIYLEIISIKSAARLEYPASLSYQPTTFTKLPFAEVI